MALATISVSYSQIAVFNGGVDDPFSVWTDQHVAQGFAWRPESVSFKTLIDAGPTSVEVVVADHMPSPSGLRAIAVPFECSEEGEVEVASISDSRIFVVPSGQYQLLFETGYSDEGNWCKFTFIRNGSKIPQIVLRDAELTPSDSLLMLAEPA